MGLVSSAWSVAAEEVGATYHLHADVPSNSRCQIIVPVSPTSTVKESGIVVWTGGSLVASGAAEVGGIVAAAVGNDGRSVVFEVGGGAYTFIADCE